MLLSIPTVPVPSSTSSYVHSHSDRSHNTSVIPATQIPKHFNVSFAIHHGYFRCVRYLLELSSDPNERDNQLRTPLILCSYVEDDRWSLSLAQNLLEKGAKIALEDHARRNAMHHACALQRFHLVQLFLSCVDFDLQAKDCEGNTSLHYAAITGNCEIAELLIKSAEKMNIRLDQYMNREGCSAAALALRYGHIECANQITHRDWDEFFVIPRPLSIYEAPIPIDHSDTQIHSKKSPKKKKVSSQLKNDPLPSALSFGLLKIIFNESDQSYSARLAGICKKGKTVSHRRMKHTHAFTSPRTIHSQVKDELDYPSTEALVNELQRTVIEEEPEKVLSIQTSGRTSPRLQLLMHQYSSEKPTRKRNDSVGSVETKKIISNRSKSIEENGDKFKSAAPISTFQRIESNSSLNYFDESPRTKTRSKRPRTAIIRPQTSTNAVGVPSRLSSIKTTSPSAHPIPSEGKNKKKSLLIKRATSASQISRQGHINLPSDSTTYSQTLFAGRPLSAVILQHPPMTNGSDISCSIREARGATRRFNNPVELFGIKPEQLFGEQEHIPKVFDPRSRDPSNHQSKSTRSKLQKHIHIWQDDIDKLVELYNIHHSSNYRTGAVPPPSTSIATGTIDSRSEGVHSSRQKKSNGNKNSDVSARTGKGTTSVTLNIPRRNSITQRTMIKVAHT